MPASYDDMFAKCPYFHYSKKKRIVCDGIMDGTTLKMDFDTQEDRNLHRRVFCDSNYEKCEINRMLEEIYDED